MPPKHHRPPDIPIPPSPPRIGIPRIHPNDASLLIRPRRILRHRKPLRTARELAVDALNMGKEVERCDQVVQAQCVRVGGDAVVECVVCLEGGGEGCARHPGLAGWCRRIGEAREGMCTGRLLTSVDRSETRKQMRRVSSAQ